MLSGWSTGEQYVSWPGGIPRDLKLEGEGACIFMLLAIDRIKVVDRTRRDLGDIQALAISIAELGLLQPVVVTREQVLVAGERRLAACKLLDWKEVEATEVKFEDYLQQLKAERDENETRKDFNFSEILNLGKKIEAVEGERARHRQQGTQFGNPVRQDFATRGDQGRVRDKVAEAVGIGSGETYRKAKFIAENANPEVIQQLDEGQISVHRAYQELTAKLKLAASEKKQLESEILKREEEIQKTTEQLEATRAELDKLRSAQPEVEEKVVEQPVFEQDPTLRAELEASRNEAVRILREKERFQARFDEVARESEEKEVKIKKLEASEEQLQRLVDHTTKELEKLKTRPKPRFDLKREEFRAVIEKAEKAAFDLSDNLRIIEEKYLDNLLASARVRGGHDVEEISEVILDAGFCKTFEIATQTAAGRLNRIFDALKTGKPALRVINSQNEN